jgi:predicted PurR-regulated permease PerM
MPAEGSNKNISILRYALSGVIAITLSFAFLATIWFLARPLAIIAMGIVVAMTFSPVEGFLGKWLPRTIAIILAYALFVLVLVGIGLIIFPPLIMQAQQASTRIPDLVAGAQAWLQQFNFIDTGSLINGITSQLGNLTSILVSLPFAIVSSLAEIVLLLVISIYWLIELPRIKRFILSLFKEEDRQKVGQVLAEMGNSMGGFLRAAVINGFAVGLMTYIGMLVIGVDFPLVLGILAGVMEIVPVLGPTIAGTIIALLALLQSPTTALIVLVFEIVMQQVENNLLVPNIMQSQTEISPLLTILALFVGGSIGGVLGALVAIPLAAALNVFVSDAVAPWVRERTGAEDRTMDDGPRTMEEAG